MGFYAHSTHLTIFITVYVCENPKCTFATFFVAWSKRLFGHKSNPLLLTSHFIRIKTRNTLLLLFCSIGLFPTPPQKPPRIASKCPYHNFAR